MDGWYRMRPSHETLLLSAFHLSLFFNIQDYHKNKLSPERIAKLEEIGFVWRLKEQPYNPRTRWDDMYQKLKSYRVWHGDCNVPGRRYQPDPSLGIWVDSQRRKYRQGKLSPEQTEQLNELGFTWSLRWDKEFERLQAFRAQFGHVNFERCKASSVCVCVFLET